MSQFNDTWIFPNLVKNTMPDCTHYTVEATTEKFNSGRVVDKITFYAGNDIIEDRKGMTLVSKNTGKPYVVCRRMT